MAAWRPQAQARGLGIQALAAGLRMLDLARLHERTMVREALPGCPTHNRAALIKKAGIFFALAITPRGKTHPRADGDAGYLKKVVETLSQRTVELAASNLELGREISERKAVEEALQKSERHHSQLLEQSARLQDQLRRLSRQLLSVQEDERKKISRELHDVIAQALTGINLRLATLKKQAALNAKGLERNIARTQRLVEDSVQVVHQFALDLRPAMLDDLGLIPALHSYMKNFTVRTGVRTCLTAFAGVEQLDTSRRTVLFRIAQEALTKVARHARAGRVEVTIQKLPAGICMTIKDDGKSFNVERALHAKRGKRLGLLGMRERLEMVGGRFTIESAPSQGTTILAQIPIGKTRAPGNQKSVARVSTINLSR